MQEKIPSKFLIFQVVSMRQRGVKINMDGGFWKRETKQTKTGKIHQNRAWVCISWGTGLLNIFIKKSNVYVSFNSVMRWLSEGRTHFDNPWWATGGVFSVRYVGTQQVCSHMTWILSFCWVTVARWNWLPSKREVAKNGWYVHNILCVFAIDPFSRIQVWPLTQFFLFLFVKNHWFAWRANQWPLIGETLFSSVPPSNSLVSVSDPRRAFWADTAPFSGRRLASCVASGTTEIQGHRQGCCSRRRGPRTPPTTADANLDCAFV